MNKIQFQGLKPGDHVMYFGESDFEEGIIQGDIFKVTRVRRSGFWMQGLGGLLEGQIVEIYLKDFDKSRSIEFYMVVPPLPKVENDETDLTRKEFEFLIDYALDLNDFEWCKQLHEAQRNCNV